jgi:hypothetical protein
MKKYRLERNGRRSFDAAVEYPTVEPTATEKTRTAKAVVRAWFTPAGRSLTSHMPNIGHVCAAREKLPPIVLSFNIL